MHRLLSNRKSFIRGFSSATRDWVAKQSIFLRHEPSSTFEEEIVRLPEHEGRLFFSEAWRSRLNATFDSPLLSQSPETLAALDAESDRFSKCKQVAVLLPSDKQVTFVRDFGSSGPESGGTAIVDLRRFNSSSFLGQREEAQLSKEDKNHRIADLAFFTLLVSMVVIALP